MDSREVVEGEQDIGNAEFAQPKVYEGPELEIEIQNADANDPAFQEKMAMLEFMSEPVTICLASPAEEQADPRCEVAVNGESAVFIRNEEIEYTVPRYIVEGLARAKPHTFGNEEYIDPKDGVMKVRHPVRMGVRYPFQVRRDDNPRGPAWLAGVLSERQ